MRIGVDLGGTKIEAIALDEMPKDGELRRYDTALRMRKRKHEVIVSLYDVASGVLGVLLAYGLLKWWESRTAESPASR